MHPLVAMASTLALARYWLQTVASECPVLWRRQRDDTSAISVLAPIPIFPCGLVFALFVRAHCGSWNGPYLYAPVLGASIFHRIRGQVDCILHR